MGLVNTVEPWVLNIFVVASLYYIAPRKKLPKIKRPEKFGPAVVGVRSALFTSIGPGFESRRRKIFGARRESNLRLIEYSLVHVTKTDRYAKCEQ